MTECAYQSCNRHIYKNSDKCILHCGKDDWFSEDTHGSRDWSNSQDKIKNFWETVRNEKMAQSDYDFNGVIFPEFEEYNSENIEEIKVNENKIYKAKGPFNFWEVDRNLIFDKKVIFSNSVFKGKTNFIFTTFQDIANFEKSTFEESVRFNGAVFFRGIYEKSTFQKETDFKFVIFLNGVNFKEAWFQDKTSIEYVIFQNIKGDTVFNGTTFQNVVSFNGSTFRNETYFSGTTFQNTAVFYALKDSDNLYFNFIKLQEKSLIDFSGFELKELKFSTIQNFSSYVRLTNIKIANKFELRNTNLGKAELNNFDLSECQEIVIKDSVFFEIVFNNLKWGKITENRFKGSRDVFRQLKHALEQQGNIIDANRFYSLEMKEYKKELADESWFSDYGQDKFVFLVHEMVSNFSQTWVLPLIWFFVIGMGFTLHKVIQTTTFEPFKGWELLLPTLLISSYIIGKLLSDTVEKFKDYQLKIYLPCFCLILFYVSSVDKPFNEFAKTVNPLGTLRNDDFYKNFEFAWFLHKSVMTFIIYQFIVTLRRQTRRK